MSAPLSSIQARRAARGHAVAAPRSRSIVDCLIAIGALVLAADAVSATRSSAPAAAPATGATTFSTVPSSAAPARGSVSTLDAPAADPTAVTTVPSAAPNWQWVGRSADGCVQHWDPATRATRGGRRQAWFMLSCADPRAFTDEPTRAAQSVQVLVVANCAARTLAASQSQAFAGLSGRGAPGPAAHRVLQSGDFIEAAPGSPGADQLRLLCAVRAPSRSAKHK